MKNLNIWGIAFCIYPFIILILLSLIEKTGGFDMAWNKIDHEYNKMANGTSPIKHCCVCHEEMYYGEEAYKTEDNLYYCEDCFNDMMQDYKITLSERDIDYPDPQDI